MGCLIKSGQGCI